MGINPGEHREKMSLRWSKGVWLGRAHISDGHLLGTKEGVVTVRAVRRHVDEQKWNAVAVSEVTGTPGPEGYPGKEEPCCRRRHGAWGPCCIPWDPRVPRMHGLTPLPPQQGV